MKHDPIATANAMAVTVAFIAVVCALAIILAPELSLGIAQSWFHGIDLSKVQTVVGPSLGSILYGWITATIGGWVVGYVFAKTYNYFLKK
ncbi:hypothetical protein A2875_00515 [Candidatus Gottesmanbacteria bacterium RIFCSPHIGHO2_01_FULL_46_14]|uniref:Uncharacterized protein n=2 Tax=Patescibacteria group TaxID=1783273 RepID=A0A1F5ZKR6_9BACT|nr:MAG: hypothetical protein UW78_C0018G0014 [Candidatus Azambacteria bacterium GW2011_GWA1_44_9]OGG13080.1 MAG: hypothetical protein A2875_00515 [Candidatus Gottesmanbacteria bacterium RIFCSPHIGHO2_01_FULL_46_14]